MAPESRIRELRIALTVDDIDKALHFYQTTLGLPLVHEWNTSGGRGYVLAFGATTLELIDGAQAEWIDEIEVGRRVSGPVRMALEVQNVDEELERFREAGAQALADPVRTPWGDYNARLQAPDGMQITLYQLSADSAAGQTDS